MVNIKLDSKWVLRSDSLQWILGQEKIVKERKRFEGKYFFSKLDDLIQFYWEMSVREGRARDFTELMEDIRVTRKELKRALTPFEFK